MLATSGTITLPPAILSPPKAEFAPASDKLPEPNFDSEGDVMGPVTAPVPDKSILIWTALIACTSRSCARSSAKVREASPIVPLTVSSPSASRTNCELTLSGAVTMSPRTTISPSARISRGPDKIRSPVMSIRLASKILPALTFPPTSSILASATNRTSTGPENI